MALERASVVKKADAWVREGKLDLAIAEYRALVDENPADSSAANTLGDLYARHGDLALAIEQYSRLGEAEWAQGFSAKAAAFYKKALKVDPDCDGALARLGEIAASQSLRKDATRHWTRLREGRRSRGDAAGEAEVASWLADLEGAGPARRQATRVALVPRAEVPQSHEPPDAPAPVVEAEPLAAAVEPTLASSTPGDDVLVDDQPSEMPAFPSLTLETFAPVADAASMLVSYVDHSAPTPGLSASEKLLATADGDADTPEASGWLTMHDQLDGLDPSQVGASAEASLQADSTAFPSGEPAASISAAEDWEVVVDLTDDGDAAVTPVDFAGVIGTTGVDDSPKTFEIVETGDPVEPASAVAPAPQTDAPVAARREEPVDASPREEPVGEAALIADLVAAAETPSLRFQASAQLGRIFLQRGDLGRGIEWLERACGVTAPVRDHGLIARYELADALERSGDTARALEVLSDLEMDAGSYRDVSTRITRLSRAIASAP